MPGGRRLDWDRKAKAPVRWKERERKREPRVGREWAKVLFALDQEWRGAGKKDLPRMRKRLRPDRPERGWGMQRMDHGDLVRMGAVMAAETGKTVLELIEEVARGDRTMTSQQLAACVAALPYRHAKIVDAKQDTRLTADPRELTDEQLAAIIQRAERETMERAKKPAVPVQTPRRAGVH